MLHANVVVTFATLIRQVWGYDDPNIIDMVRTTIYRLRRKLKDDPTQPHLLQSVAGIGLRLTDQSPPPKDGQSLQRFVTVGTGERRPVTV